ncbi:MAG: hypothetical protein DRP10_02350 [Candidatus Aenigmatarchaeota archaeon]|nr:MAG: hypothetical protein DRP10_02350 [Candidatus Aenigmarchaeota archaeon]
MIKNLEINNFKSIRNLKLKCKKINIFIGEPNTGKSNILEALGIFSFGQYGNLKDFVRFENMSNLFYDENLENAIKIKADDRLLEISFKNGKFKGTCHLIEKEIFHFDYDYNAVGTSSYSQEPSLFKFYKFVIRENFPKKEADFLLPPFGENLLAILSTNKELRTIVSEIFNRFGLKLVLKPQEKKIEVLKQYEDVFISLPYSLASDTLQRIVFYLAIVYSNKNSILTFEEPESYAFPYYTKYLAELIALDKNNNQFFISTHNPYFLLSVLEKSAKDDVAIFITFFEKYQTKIKILSEKEKEEILDGKMDVFFNIERFLEK